MSSATEEQNASTLDPVSTEDLESSVPILSKDFWFKDGNLVLQAESTQFRVHQSVLARHSSIFDDMLSLPQPVNPSDNDSSVEGCPVVHLADSALDAENFLGFLYDGVHYVAFTKSVPPLEIDKLVAMARLGKKYDVQTLKDCALAYLQHEYPTTLREWHDTHEEYSLFMTDDQSWTEIINLMHELSLFRLLPIAYVIYIARMDDVDELFANSTSTPLINQAHVQALQGRDAVIHWMNERRFQDSLTITAELLKSCSRKESCTPHIFSIFTRLETMWPGIPNRHYFTALPPWDSILDSENNISNQLCSKCVAKMKEKCERIMEDLWAKLPEFFGLGNSWEDLKNSEL